jgi:hypothetical protein
MGWQLHDRSRPPAGGKTGAGKSTMTGSRGAITTLSMLLSIEKSHLTNNRAIDRSKQDFYHKSAEA